jgi:hypothetical protein
MTGAAGARSWLQAQDVTWLTPARLKTVTVGLFAAAAIGSSVTFSGSTSTGAHAAPSPAPHAATQTR